MFLMYWCKVASTMYKWFLFIDCFGFAVLCVILFCAAGWTAHNLQRLYELLKGGKDERERDRESMEGVAVGFSLQQTCLEGEGKVCTLVCVTLKYSVWLVVVSVCALKPPSVISSRRVGGCQSALGIKKFVLFSFIWVYFFFGLMFGYECQHSLLNVTCIYY